MPQLHLYVNEELAEYIRKRAKAKGLSVSRYLAELARQDAGTGWPKGFFEEVVGGWMGEPLRRGSQGKLEKREEL